MGALRIAASIAFAWLLVASSDARANDFSFGGVGADFVPRKETRIRMVSEDIVARVEGNVWYVDAKYIFENPTDETIELDMGFPESRCTGDTDCRIEVPFRNMRTWVQGIFVDLHRGSAWLRKEFPELGNVWMYKATFGARERVEIRHKYQVNSSSTLLVGLEFGYVVRTGALWAGPVGHARFRFLMPPLARFVVPPKVGNPSLPHWTVVDGQVWTEVSVEFKDWTPTEDLWVAFNDDLPEGTWESFLSKDLPDLVPGCALNIYDALEDSDAQGEKALTAKWAAYGIDKIRACRQRLIASYGARFRSERLNEFFYGRGGFVDRGPPYLGFEPNARFSVGVMSPTDQVIYEALVRAERVAPRIAPTSEETFDVTLTPAMTVGVVGDIVRFEVLPDFPEGTCALSLYGRVRFADRSGVFGRNSKNWSRGRQSIAMETVVVPSEFDSWFGDKAWLRLGIARNGTDLGAKGHHTKLAMPVRPAPYEIVATPTVSTKFAKGELPRLSARRDGERINVDFWLGGVGTSDTASAKTKAIVVRSGQREIVYIEVSAQLGYTGNKTVGGLVSSLSYSSVSKLPVDVVVVSKAEDGVLRDALSIDKQHLK